MQLGSRWVQEAENLGLFMLTYNTKCQTVFDPFRLSHVNTISKGVWPKQDVK